MRKHLIMNLNMQKSTADLACFIKTVDGKLSDMVVTYIDNTASTENKKFEEESKTRERVYDSKPMIHHSFIFWGCFWREKKI